MLGRPSLGEQWEEQSCHKKLTHNLQGVSLYHKIITLEFL
jgi:hypothetical protein